MIHMMTLRVWQGERCIPTSEERVRQSYPATAERKNMPAKCSATIPLQPVGRRPSAWIFASLRTLFATQFLRKIYFFLPFFTSCTIEFRQIQFYFFSIFSIPVQFSETPSTAYLLALLKNNRATHPFWYTIKDKIAD